MKNGLKRRMETEEGKVLVLVLVLLIVGGLLLSPLLGLMGTGLASGQIYEKKTSELYAADAGVEQAIWHLERGGDPNAVLTFSLNGKDVVVTMTYLNPGKCDEPAMYEIVSTATGEDGSSTTVTAHVSNITVYIESGILNQGVIIGGNVYSPGDLFLDENAQIHGNVIVEGDLELNKCALVAGVVCVGGHLTLNEEAQIQSDIYVWKSLEMRGGVLGSWVDGYVYVRGEEMRDEGDGPFVVKMSGKADILKDLWVGGGTAGSVQVDKNASVMEVVHVTADPVLAISGYVGGRAYDYYHHDCPLVFTDPEITVWLIS